MNETELWIEQARKYLEEAHRRGGEAQGKTFELNRTDLARIQADLGCGDDCFECSWGTLGGQPLGSEPCRLLALQDGIEALRASAAGRATRRKEAAALLSLLDSLPARP